MASFSGVILTSDLLILRTELSLFPQLLMPNLAGIGDITGVCFHENAKLSKFREFLCFGGDLNQKFG